jgi:hypothetical protein
MNVRRRGDRVVARADDPDDVALRDDVAPSHPGRSELKQRHGVAGAGLDRDRATAVGNGPGERDGARCRGGDGGTELGADVDAAVLPARVRVGAERERAEHLAGDGPGPGGRSRGGRERRRKENRENEHAPHEDRLRRREEQHRRR